MEQVIRGVTGTVPWTEIMQDENVDMKDRLRSSEYIAKTNGAFVKKKELKAALDGKIIFGFEDPTIDDS
ncbi:hypothetical protein [Neobacillus sp. NPDC093127]|uniref:hypothetical protein n=1 Tax=Neobacillus sp. NPDC093127 TaxID=3364296 RepID=UPI0038220A7D